MPTKRESLPEYQAGFFLPSPMQHIQPVPLAKAYRLINHGPTVMVSAKHEGVENAMSAAWACALDFDKVSVVIDKGAYTRGLVERSGYFALQIPTAAQAELVLAVGEKSRHRDPEKMQGVGLFYQPGFDVPLMQGCAAWLLCQLIPEAHNQQAYDLFIGRILAAWADDRVFANGRWHFDDAPDEWRTLHYVAGGQFYAIGRGMAFSHGPDMD